MTKSASPIPEGYRNITPYLVVRGVSQLLDFLHLAFQAQELIRALQSDGSITHAAVKIGDSIIEMGDTGGLQLDPLPGQIHFYLRDLDAAFRRAISSGAKSLYEPAVMPYGDREAGIEDPCGNQWFLSTHIADNSYRPVHLHDITTGVRIKGAEEFLNFVQIAFGASILAKHDSPDGAISNAVFQIGDSTLECGEAHGQWSPRTCALHYYTQDCDSVFNHALTAGAKLYLPMKDQFYGDRGGGLIDLWGNHWYIATRKEDLTLEEIRQRAARAS